VDEGRTFAFVSGLGGKSIRDQERDGEITFEEALEQISAALATLTDAGA
jgi:hypothetical protein